MNRELLPPQFTPPHDGMSGKLQAEAMHLADRAHKTHATLENVQTMHDRAHTPGVTSHLPGDQQALEMVATSLMLPVARVRADRALDRAKRHYRNNEEAYQTQAALDAARDGVELDR